jgi:flagellar basal body rod protein FlgB
VAGVGNRPRPLELAGRAQLSEYEVAPDGNAVVLEEQSAKAAETALDFQLTSNLYRKYLGMVRIALGHQT